MSQDDVCCYTACLAGAVAVKTSDSHSPVTRFGVFELGLRSRELHKQGMKIRLQGQPVEILVMLLERPGEVVTREELQKKLWPADTGVGRISAFRFSTHSARAKDWHLGQCRSRQLS